MSWRSTIPTTKYPALREGATIVCYLLIGGRPMPYTMTMLERRAARYKDRNTPPARKGITTMPDWDAPGNRYRSEYSSCPEGHYDQSS